MPPQKLKILFFSQRFLLPMDTGGKIRTGKMLEELRKDVHITLLCNVERNKDDPWLGQTKQLCDEFHHVPWREVPKYSWFFYVRVLIRFFGRYPIAVQNLYSRDLEQKILELAQQNNFDLLVCDFLQPALNFRQVMAYPTLLFQHNVESLLLKQYYEKTGNVIMKFFWWAQWKKLERFEKQMCRRFDSIVAVSEQDKSLLEKHCEAGKVYSVSTGVDIEYFSPDNQPTREHSLIYVGAMDWLPNEDAILYFAQTILPHIKTKIPDITLTIVGRNPSHSIRRALQPYPEVHLIGGVEDVRPYIRQASVYIIPLRIGGGTRIKVYEAMAMGKAIVSTRVGVEGLSLEDGRHVLLADQPEEFSESVIRLLDDRFARDDLGAAARTFVEKGCGWNHAARSFADICLQVVRSRQERQKN